MNRIHKRDNIASGEKLIEYGRKGLKADVTSVSVFMDNTQSPYRIQAALVVTPPHHTCNIRAQNTLIIPT
jgi:hypothetical protein